MSDVGTPAEDIETLLADAEANLLETGAQVGGVVGALSAAIVAAVDQERELADIHHRAKVLAKVLARVIIGHGDLLVVSAEDMAATHPKMGRDAVFHMDVAIDGGVTMWNDTERGPEGSAV